MKTSRLSFAVVAALALPLCAQAQVPPGHPPAGGPGGAPPNAPFAGGKALTTAEALKEAPKDDTSLAPLAKTFADAEAKLKKSPKSADVKKAYVEAAYKYGHTILTDKGKMSAKVQYRAALALYRKALAVDPKHKPSLDDKKLIEDVYTNSLHMPIPK